MQNPLFSVPPSPFSFPAFSLVLHRLGGLPQQSLRGKDEPPDLQDKQSGESISADGVLRGRACCMHCQGGTKCIETRPRTRPSAPRALPKRRATAPDRLESRQMCRLVSSDDTHRALGDDGSKHEHRLRPTRATAASSSGGQAKHLRPSSSEAKPGSKEECILRKRSSERPDANRGRVGGAGHPICFDGTLPPSHLLQSPPLYAFFPFFLTTLKAPKPASAAALGWALTTVEVKQDSTRGQHRPTIQRMGKTGTHCRRASCPC